MPKQFAKLCLSLLVLAQLAQGVTVFATITEPSSSEPITTTSELPSSTLEVPPSSEEPLSTTFSSEEPTTTVQEPTVSTSETPSTIEEEPSTTISSEEPATSTVSPSTSSNSDTPKVKRDTDEKQDQPQEEPHKESLGKVGGTIYTVLLPNGQLGIKVGLDTLIKKKHLYYKVISQKTGKLVDNGYLVSEGVDRSALKDMSNLGQPDFENVFAQAVGSYKFESDPKGSYKIQINSTSTSPNREITLEKTIYLGSQPSSHPAFPKVGVTIDPIVLPNGALTFKVRLDTMQGPHSFIRYQIIHQQTGTIVASNTIKFKDVDRSVLKDKQTSWPQDHYNMMVETLKPDNFRHDPKGTYSIRIFGHVNNSKSQVAGSVDTSKVISLNQPSTTTHPSLPTVNPLIDTVVLPSKELVIKMRTDFLTLGRHSEIYYDLVEPGTGKVIKSGKFYQSKVDASVLKNKAHLGEADYVNDWNASVHSIHIAYPQGTYHVRIYGTAQRTNGTKKTTVLIKGEKTISFKQTSATHPLFPTMGGVADLKLLADKKLELTVRLDSVVDKHEDINYQIVHQKSGKEIASGELLVNHGIDQVVLKNKSLQGTLGKHNVAKKTFSSPIFDGTYIVKIVGKTSDYKLVNIQQTVVFDTVGKKLVYRMYHASSQSHLYTTSEQETNLLKRKGWTYEGVAWVTETQKGDPVYRLYHSKLQKYFYTKNTNEYRNLAKKGWRQEGIAYRSFGSQPVYRLYHKASQKYFYTRSKQERDGLVGRGWKAEGIAWYSHPF